MASKGKDFYEGWINNGVPYGRGRMIYANGNVYIGEFNNNERNGFAMYFK